MLTLRLQRTGRKKLPQYRLIAQEHSLSPKSGRVSAYLGTFNPTSKEFKFDEEAVKTHLGNGAQPSQKVAKLLKKAGVKLPKWVTIHEYAEKKKPEPAKEEATASTEDADQTEDVVAEESPADEAQEPEAEDAKTDETDGESSAEDENVTEESK